MPTTGPVCVPRRRPQNFTASKGSTVLPDEDPRNNNSTSRRPFAQFFRKFQEERGQALSQFDCAASTAASISMLSRTSSQKAALPDAILLVEALKAGELSVMPFGVGANVSWSVANAHDNAMDASSKAAHKP
eukprot:CAMPEP_0203918254 /NCGR_PEP_ID=MMETSP0359-20131031/58793_1 /ASSEMBLY_ACC=CAM_ASM_000338 /TAXON_ID=268821 /ORGANISM="Scrippsiella Hangoei, Strain SHTV-5" /LENGTH=131 /DNA_ID=CAMNT_0050845303 /DNA_START=67 /DNA_END=459 /DNA_ORIENTATION=+